VAGSDVEIEAKFYLRHLAALRQTLLDLGAHLLAPRLLEKNLRFDTPDRRLTRTGAVLRLRQDRAVHLTFKTPGKSAEVRNEIEFEVDDLEAARAFLSALGFELVFTYEKYREVFALDPVKVMLDELPFGCFAEIEGPTLPAITEAADRLGLAWERRIPQTYLALFESLRRSMRLAFRDATFANFSGRSRITAQQLEVLEATSSQAAEDRS
jgi:adenylate cyclase class 2